MPILELPVFQPLCGVHLSPFPVAMPFMPLAEISGAQWVAIAAILGGLTFTILLIIFGLKFVQRREELWHETARIALDKGQPLPPLPSDMRDNEVPNRNNDLRAGLIMVATGAGLYLFFATFLPGLRYVATIPGFIGIGLLFFAGIDTLTTSKDQPPADRPPQS